MGCFNVVCSVSNLSLNYGTKVAFLPLLPNAYGKVHQIKPSSSLIYPNCYFNPFSLPIFGEYNDYGSLENIEEDDNTKAIEAFFGISIEQFIGIVTCGRDITDYYGELFKAYATHQNLMSDYAVKVDDAFLTTLGFVHAGKKRYTYEDYPLYVDASDGNYQMYDTSGRLIGQSSGYGAKSSLMKDFEKKTGYLLLVPKEKQEKVKLIRTLSGMFVHATVYKELADFHLKQTTLVDGYVTEQILETLGFTFKEETEEGNVYQKEKVTHLARLDRSAASILDAQGGILNPYSFSLREFAKQWENITGDVFDLQPFELIYTYDVAFDAFTDWLNQTMKEQSFYREPFGHHEYGRFFEDWTYFEKFYIPLIKEGKLKEALTNYKAFYFSMYSCNRFFFPGMNGEQHGNLEASKTLLETSLAIVNEALAERDY